MTAVRSAMVRHLAEALGCQRYHMHTGHPLLVGEAGFPNPSYRLQ
jgi:hypothetical protein